MKRREIVVEQAEPWGPIVARATTAEERAAAGVEAVATDAPLDEIAGVVRMTDAIEPRRDRRARGRGAIADRRALAAATRRPRPPPRSS